MAFVYVPWDFFVKPVSADAEAWFGFLLHGWAAKATEPLHGAIYAAGAYGLWRMRPWMWPWAALYVAQVALGMAIWSIGHFGGARGVAIGAASAAPFAALAVALWRARDRFRTPRPRMGERFPGHALVTGASSGIGEGFARALAREGMPVVLAARRGDRLRALAARIEAEHGVATRVVEVDLARPDGAGALADAVADLAIDVLVNNAGIGDAGRFDTRDEARLLELVQLNCAAPLVLTRRLLPAMRARGRGAVVLTGSLAAKQPMPLHATYAASKAFVGHLGEALWAEALGTGVDVVVVEPGTTDTEFQAVAGEVAHAGEPVERVVAAALDALGRQPSVGVGWWRWLRSTLGMRLLPRSLLALAAQRVMQRHTPADRH
jgi:hypothetical protein